MTERSRRSSTLFALGLVTVIAVTACGEEGGSASRSEPRTPPVRGDDSALAVPGHPLSSPSGAFRLEVIEGDYEGAEGRGRFWRFRIARRDTESEYESRKRFSVRSATFVTWDRDGRVWVYSGDVGTYVWEREGAGRWRERSYAELVRADRDPPPPHVLVEARPNEFGPEGRKKVLETQRQRPPVDGRLRGVPPLTGDEVAPDDPRVRRR